MDHVFGMLPVGARVLPLAAHTSRVDYDLFHGAQKKLAGGTFRVKGLIPDFLAALAIENGPRPASFMIKNQATVRPSASERIGRSIHSEGD